MDGHLERILAMQPEPDFEAEVAKLAAEFASLVSAPEAAAVAEELRQLYRKYPPTDS